MNDVVETFLTTLGADGATPANTVTAYRTDLTQYVTFVTAQQGRADVAELRADDLQAFCTWLQEQGYAAATIARRIVALRAFGAYLMTCGILDTNPAAMLARPRLPQRAARRLTTADLTALRAATLAQRTPESWRDRALIEVLAATGLRASELISLDVADLALEDSTVTVRDGSGEARQVTLTAEAVMALVTYLQLGRPRLLKRDGEERALLLNCRGQRLTRQGCWEILQKYARQLQLDGVSLEQLRQLSSQHGMLTRSA